MYQQQRIITSNYQIISEDEYTVLLVYAINSDIQIYLPYASNFDKVIILKADNTLNEVFVNLKGNDTFEGGKSPYRLTSQYQLVEFTTDNESKWYAVSVYSSGSAASGGSSGGVSVHSALAGLSANDHRQYLHVSGSNNLASNFNFAGFSIYDINTINGVNILSITASLDSHILDTNNPHATTFSNLDPGTLAQLNAAVIDANLDDSGSARPPLAHSASHMSGGSDPININQLGARGVPEGHTFAVGPNGNVVTVLTSSLGVTNHGSLNGLGNLDHPQYETTASFRPFSESVKTFTSSVVTFSSSYSSRISSLEAQSASITSSLQILQNASSSFRADIGDLQTASASFSLRTTNLESASGTFVTQINQLFAASASFDNTSASYARFSASFVDYSASWSMGTTDLTSLNSFSQSVQSFTASVQSFTASHASRHLSGGADPIDAQNLRADGIGIDRLLISNGLGGWTTVPSSSVGGGGGSTNISALNSFSASAQQHTASIQTFSASILAASSSWVYQVGVSALPMSSSRWYTLSGVGVGAGISIATWNANERMELAPAFRRREIKTLAGIGAVVANGGGLGTFMKIVIYLPDQDGWPATLHWTSSLLSAASAGFREQTTDLPTDLNNYNLLWCGVVISGSTTTQMRCHNISDTYDIGRSNPAFNPNGSTAIRRDGVDINNISASWTINPLEFTSLVTPPIIYIRN